MSNPALQWISEAYQGNYLRATFIDCQRGEYKQIEDKTPFTTARDFANDLRDHKNVPITHFLYGITEPASLQPFLYKGAQHHRFSNRDIDFQGVIPQDGEWVYPKRTFNGFTNPYSREVLGNVDRNPDPSHSSLLICAGFTSRCCLIETAIGSFEKAANPDKHKVVITLDATNLHEDFYEDYIDFAREKADVADEATKEKIGFAITPEISDTLTKTAQARPLQSSPTHPYRA